MANTNLSKVKRQKSILVQIEPRKSIINSAQRKHGSLFFSFFARKMYWAIGFACNFSHKRQGSFGPRGVPRMKTVGELLPSCETIHMKHENKSNIHGGIKTRCVVRVAVAFCCWPWGHVFISRPRSNRILTAAECENDRAFRLWL